MTTLTAFEGNLSGDTKFTLRINQTGWYRVRIGGKNQSWGDESVTLNQGGEVYSDFNAITSRTSKVLCLSSESLNIVVDEGSSGSIDWRIPYKIEKI